MMRRLLLVQVPLALVALGWYWLLHTQSGAHWIWTRASAATSDALQMDELSGDFGAGVTISGLQFANDTVNVNIDTVAVTASLSVLPLQLQLSNVAFNGVDLETRTSNRETASNDLSSVLETLSMPLPIDVADVTVDDIVIGIDNSMNRFVVERVTASMLWHKRVVIRKFEVVAQSASTRLSGFLEFRPPFAAHVNGGLSFRSTLIDRAQNHDIEFSGDGDLSELTVFLTSSPIESSLKGLVLNLLTSPAWDLQLDIPRTGYVLGGDNMELVNLHATTMGSSNKYSLHASADIEMPDRPSIRFSAKAGGNLSGLKLNEIFFINDGTRLYGSGDIDWSDNWSINAILDLQALDVNPWFSAWPATHPLHGKLRLTLDQKFLRINDSYLAVKDTPLSINATLEIDLEASVVSADLGWKHLGWPIEGDSALITSDAGNLALNGSFDDWRVKGLIAVGTATIPSGRFRIDGHGDRDHIQGAISEGSVFGGTATGSAAYNWNEHRWSAALDVAEIDFGSVIKTWPGVVQGHIDASGQNAPFRLDLQIDKLRGTLRDLPIAVDGHIGLGKKRFDALDLLLTHGESNASLNGDLYAVAGLAFDINVDDTGRYVSESTGSFDAAGRLSLHDSMPALHINGSSKGIQYGNLKATDIAIADQSTTDRGINAEVTVAEIDVAGTAIEEIRLLVNMDKDSQSVQFDGLYGPARVHLLVAGAMIDRPDSPSWSGQLQELELTIADTERLTLLEPADLQLSATRTSIRQACIGNDNGMRLCTTADWNAHGEAGLSMDLIDLPADLTNAFADTSMKFEQLLSGNLNWRADPDSGVTGSGKLTLSPGTVASNDRPELAIETGRGELAFDIENGKLLSGNAALPMPGFGNINAEFSVSDISNTLTSSVTGSLDLTVLDIELLASYLPVIDAAHGSLQTNLRLAGTLAEPLVTGHFELGGSRIVYLPIGLTIEELNLSGNLQADGLFQLNGTFKAGEGRGEIKNRSNRRDISKRFLELELRGDNLTLVDVEDIQASANLDVQISYGQDTLTIGGRIEIPRAHIQPSNLNLARDAESDDVVIVAGELPEGSTEGAERSKLQIAGSLEVAFGDDISIDLGLASAKLTGRTLFTWEDDIIPMADGRYDLTGSVQAFGQVLEITEGGLQFPKIPADNPFIRVRAVRQIYGNPQVKTAGILVDGTVRRPSITAYTDPFTTEERALAMLVTGSDFDFEQGVGAIDFGTYIAPRIFVSYGVSLFEQENVLRVRYDLSRGFGITATSGDNEAGLDLNYRLER